MAEADLKLDGLSIWVRGRQFPSASDYYDANWLVMRVTMERGRTSVTADGAILMTSDFERFRNELAAMNQIMKGEANLAGYEPNLTVSLAMGRLGHIGGRIEITPDHLGERHSFEIGALDQSYLPKLITSCDELLRNYPVVNRPNS
jgi:hypothetical protein